jgi:pimeloyl-ACP methyl ester carboxylesterase
MQMSFGLPRFLLGATLAASFGLHAQSVEIAGAATPVPAAMAEARAGKLGDSANKLIVIGFMGGNVSADNLLHREALVAQELQQHDPANLRTAVFANHHGQDALHTVLRLLDADGDGRLSAGEKSAARIVIYGHSWGASETVTLARRLNELGIPVLLTIQVDSVEKSDEDDRSIPPNVREAVNFYQTRGLIHGRTEIAAMDPSRTTILGNFESSYREHPISCAGFPWFARTFMKPHIEIENDASLWTRIEALIRAKIS